MTSESTAVKGENMTLAKKMRSDPRYIRTFMESPILDDHKWTKAHDMPFDALLVDLEDTVAPDRKSEARVRAAATLTDPSVENKFLIPRVNALETGYFDDDIGALAGTGVEHLVYPKLQSIQELEEALAKLDAVGLRAQIFASIEGAEGVQNVDTLAAHPRVSALLFGPSDLGLNMGLPLQEAKDITGPALQYARSRVVMAAAANRKAAITMAFPQNMKDSEETSIHIRAARTLGFTGMMTFYPPHLQLILDVFSPSEAAVSKALETVAVYRKAREDGMATAYLESGELILAFDFAQAEELLVRHGVYAGAQG